MDIDLDAWWRSELDDTPPPPASWPPWLHDLTRLREAEAAFQLDESKALVPSLARVPAGGWCSTS